MKALNKSRRSAALRRDCAGAPSRPGSRKLVGHKRPARMLQSQNGELLSGAMLPHHCHDRLPELAAVSAPADCRPHLITANFHSFSDGLIRALDARVPSIMVRHATGLVGLILGGDHGTEKPGRLLVTLVTALGLLFSGSVPAKNSYLNRVDSSCESNFDCDDNKSGINPGAAESCGDGMDNDVDNKVDCPDKQDCRTDPVLFANNFTGGVCSDGLALRAGPFSCAGFV